MPMVAPKIQSLDIWKFPDSDLRLKTWKRLFQEIKIPFHSSRRSLYLAQLPHMSRNDSPDETSRLYDGNTPGMYLGPESPTDPSSLASPSNDQLTAIPPLSSPPLRTRWIVLASFSLLTLTSSWMWITWSPIEKHVVKLWNVTDADVDALSMVFMYSYVPLSFPALWLLQRVGMRNGLLLGAAFNLAGSIVRWLRFESYSYVYLGTVLCSIAQTFTLAVPPLLSHSWFPLHERALATSVGVLANQMGTCFGLGASIMIDLSMSAALSTYLGVQCFCAGFAALLILIFVTNGHNTINHETPSKDNYENQNVHTETNDENELFGSTTEKKDDMTYANSLRKVLCSSDGVVLNIVYGINVGAFYSSATFLSQMLPQWSVEGQQQILIGWLGIALVLGGVGGSITTGMLIDRKYFTYYEMTRLLLIGATLSVGCFTAAVEWCASASDSHVPVFLAISFVGFCLTAVISVGFEYGTHLAKPANEAVVGGIYNATAQAGGVFMVLVGSWILGNNASRDSILMLNFMVLFSLLVGVVLFSVKMKR